MAGRTKSRPQTGIYGSVFNPFDVFRKANLEFFEGFTVSRMQRLERKISSKFELCGSVLGSRVCDACGSSTLVSVKCDTLLCPDCAKRRSRRVFDKYVQFARSSNRSFVFLTLACGVRGAYVQQAIHDKRREFYRLVNSLWGAACFGGLYCFEWGENSGQLHLHAILSTSLFVPQASVSEAWSSLSGNLYVYIKKLRGVGAIKYLAKYMSKSQTSLFFAAEVAGRRRIGSFGCFYKISYKVEKYPCSCGSVSFHLLLRINFVENPPCPHGSPPLEGVWGVGFDPPVVWELGSNAAWGWFD